MGVGNLHIGENIGGAQVFGHNPLVQQFGDMLAQRKARQDKDNQFLNEQLAQNYDPNSLRNDADKQSYLKQYSDIKNQAISAENEKDDKKRALAIAEVRQQLGNLGAYAEGSKKQGALEKQLAMEFMKNPDHYEDDSVQKYKNGLALEWKHPDVINNAASVERRPDPTKLLNKYNKLKTDLIKPTQWDNGKISNTTSFDGIKHGQLIQNRGVPIDGDSGAFETFMHMASADPDFKKGLRDMYPEINTGNPQQDLALRARKYMHDQGDEQGFFDKPKETPLTGRAPIRPSFHDIEYHKKYGVWPTGDATSSEATPIVQKYVAPMVTGGLPELQKFTDIIPKDNFRKGETVKPEIVNGYHVFHVPDQVEVDPKIVAKNADYKKKYEDSPEKKGGILGFGGKPVPWEQSEAYQRLHKDPYKVKEHAQDVTLDPNDKADYAAKTIELAKKLKVPMTDINRELSQKGGKGMRPEFQQPKEYKIGGKSYKADAVKKAAEASGMTVEEYIKEANGS